MKEVCGLAPYEKRIIELLKVSKDKRALKLAKKRVSAFATFTFACFYMNIVPMGELKLLHRYGEGVYICATERSCHIGSDNLASYTVCTSRVYCELCVYSAFGGYEWSTHVNLCT